MTDYEGYYWQNEKVRLRLEKPQDRLDNRVNDFDSQGWALVHEEIKLPPRQKNVDLTEDPAEPNEKCPAFSVENLEGDYVGHIHFNFIDERHGTFSIGAIISKGQRGKGYGKAAMDLLLNYAFNERRLHKFSGFCLDINETSARMMEALGCKREGVLRDVVYMNGRHHNQYLYGITAEEYRQRQTEQSQ